MNFYIKILDLSEVLQGIAITNIPGHLNLKSRHSFGQRWSFFSRYCLQTKPQWIFTSKSWIWVKFCRVLPLQIYPAIWTWSLATLLAKGEVFSQDIASKPGLNEFLHQNLGFEWGSAGYYHYKYFWLFELEVKPLFWPKVRFFSQDIASKPGLNEYLHQNLGFEWGSAGYYHCKYFRLFELEV